MATEVKGEESIDVVIRPYHHSRQVKTAEQLPDRPRSGETQQHKLLKALAFHWAREQGLRIAGTEVAFPHRRVRVDVAAFKPKYKVPWRELPETMGVTAIFECKQARSDLVKDNGCRAATGRKLEKLFERKVELERLLKVHLPHLAKGEALFPEIDCYSFEHIRHDGHARTLRSIRIAQAKLEAGVKFDTLIAYRLANLHYVVTPPEIVKEHEIPLGWGWLVLQGQNLFLRMPPVWIETTLAVQQICLQRIALSGTTLTSKIITPHNG